jgi:RimJ/RimL family protein N-acetyltransferase
LISSTDKPAQGVEWVVRATTEAELDAVIDLTEEVAAEGRWIATESGFDRAERKARLQASLTDPNAGSFVADASGAIVGSAGVGRSSEAVPATMGMMVAADWRGRGVGSALLAACIDWARSVGAHKVALDLWPDNEAAFALYRKFGFVQEGYFVKHYRRRNGELWDSIEMGLLL